MANKFAESVINGTYKKREEENNTQQPTQTTQTIQPTQTTQVTQPTIKNSFADSVINGTYESNKFKSTDFFNSAPAEFGGNKKEEEDNGYQFGDFTKGLLSAGGDLVKGAVDIGGKVIGTAADVGGNLLHGGLQALEGGADALTYLGADINDLLGRSEEAEKLRQNAKFNSVGALFGENKANENLVQQNVLEALDKNSWAPEIIDDISGGVGGVAMNAALAYVTGGGNLSTAASNASIFTTSYGDAMSRALNDGASVGDARLTALIDATASTVAENAFDGLTGLKSTGYLGKTLNGKIGNAFNNVIKSDKGKALFNVLKSAVEEGSEEVIEPMISNFSQSLAHDLISSYEYNADKYSSNPFEEFIKPLTQKETLESFVMAALTSAVYNTGANAITNRINNTQEAPQMEQPIEQTQMPQIQTNQENNINNQPVMEQPQIDLKQANNEVIQTPIQEVQQNSIANDSNAFNLGKINESNSLKSIRSNEDISNKQTNAYQFDNPEVKPYFRDAAYDLKDALENYTTKGERFMREDGTFGGTKFSSTKEIASLKDDYNMNYKDIDRGIDGIIKDNGAENNAASKKVELVIDDMLRKGYKSSTPDTIKPNQDYLDTLSGKLVNNQINEQVDEELPFFESEEIEQTPKEQKTNNNLAETKQEDVLKITNKETSKNIADNLTKAIEGRNDSQNIKEIVRNVEQETGKKMRSWVETATTSTGTTELVNSMNKEKITYEPTSNKKNLDNANRELAGMNYEQKLEKAKALINGDKRLNSTDIAVLETVIQEAQKNGKMNDFMDLVQETAILGTESGQVVQALSLIRQSDPTTQLSTLQKLIEKEQAKGNKVYDGVKIKEDLVENVLNSYNEDGTWNQEKFDNAMYELKQDIVNQMHVRPSEKFTAWRYLSMLGNPKTHIRNVVANIAMSKLQGTKNKIASGIEAIAPINKLNKLLGGSEEATRGHTLRKATQEVKKYSNEAIDNYFKEHKQTSKYKDNIKGLKSELESERKIFSEKTPVGKTLNKLDKANSKALDLEDVKFNQSMTKKAFSEFLTANGIETQQDIDNNPELVAQGLEYALFKGNEATFHQHSQTGTALRNFRESLRQGSNLSRTIGLGMDATLPFINTPINIAKTGIEYTPGLGMLKTISDVQKAPKNLKADVFVDSISKQFAGGMLAAVGFELARQGILNGKGGDDKKDKLEKNLGKQDYSINLFGNTYDLSWLSPSAMPLFVGVETYNATKGKGISADTALNILSSTIDPLSEMSVISSVTEALQSYSKGTQALGDIASSALTSYISQYVPTLSGQVATVFDDTQRNSAGNTLGEKIINQVKYKIPGLRNTLPAQTNVWGEEKKYAENPLIRAAEAFLSPANRKEVKVDDTTKEVERVYDNTGSGLPSLNLTKTPKIDTENYNLSSEEYTQYKKDYGKNAKEMLDDLMKTDDYKNANDVEKSKMISAIYEYSTYMARKKIADKNNLKFEYKKSNGKSYNYPKYYISLNKDDFAEYVADKYKDYDE